MATESSPRRRASKTAPARAYHHGDLPNALREASFKLIEKNGVEDFSLREAAAQCGVAVSAAYKHYPSKDALLTAVADRGFELLASQTEQRMARVAEGRKGKARAEAVLVESGRTYILFAVEHPNLHRLMYGPHGPKGGNADGRPDAPAHRVGSLLVQALRDVMECYGHKNESVARHMLISWALVHGFAMMVIDGVWVTSPERPLEPMIAELGQALLRSLR